jgi:hypothetical protein
MAAVACCWMWPASGRCGRGRAPPQSQKNSDIPRTRRKMFFLGGSHLGRRQPARRQRGHSRQGGPPGHVRPATARHGCWEGRLAAERWGNILVWLFLGCAEKKRTTDTHVFLFSQRCTHTRAAKPARAPSFAHARGGSLPSPSPHTRTHPCHPVAQAEWHWRAWAASSRCARRKKQKHRRHRGRIPLPPPLTLLHLIPPVLPLRPRRRGRHAVPPGRHARRPGRRRVRPGRGPEGS